MAKLKPITMHEARHTFASTAIAAGVNVKPLSAYMGHGTISMTLDRYGHLLPGSESEAVGLLDAYLLREMSQNCRSRSATSADLSDPERGRKDGATPASVSETA